MEIYNSPFHSSPQIPKINNPAMFFCLLACLLACLFVCLFVCLLSLLGPWMFLLVGCWPNGWPWEAELLLEMQQEHLLVGIPKSFRGWFRQLGNLPGCIPWWFRRENDRKLGPRMELCGIVERWKWFLTQEAFFIFLVGASLLTCIFSL